MLAFVIWPLARVIVQGFFIAEGQPNAGAFNLDQFARYVNPKYVVQYWQIFIWTIRDGVLTAIGSTALGFLFAYTVVRCNIPFKRVIHAITLLRRFLRRLRLRSRRSCSWAFRLVTKDVCISSSSRG